MTTIRVATTTRDLLKRLKEQKKARSFDRLLRELVAKELGERRERGRVVVEEAEKEEGDDQIPEKCPHCGSRLQGNNVRVELHNVHIPIPKIGIEIQYLGCPFCERPLTKTLQWRKTEKFKIPTT